MLRHSIVGVLLSLLLAAIGCSQPTPPSEVVETLPVLTPAPIAPAFEKLPVDLAGWTVDCDEELKGGLIYGLLRQLNATDSPTKEEADVTVGRAYFGSHEAGKMTARVVFKGRVRYLRNADPTFSDEAVRLALEILRTKHDDQRLGVEITPREQLDRRKVDRCVGLFDIYAEECAAAAKPSKSVRASEIASLRRFEVHTVLKAAWLALTGAELRLAANELRERKLAGFSVAAQVRELWRVGGDAKRPDNYLALVHERVATDFMEVDGMSAFSIFRTPVWDQTIADVRGMLRKRGLL